MTTLPGVCQIVECKFAERLRYRQFKFNSSDSNRIEEYSMDENNINLQLLKACQENDFDTVKKIIESGKKQKAYDINYSDDRGYTPLMLSVKHGNLDIVKLLIKNKADIHAKNSSGDTALMGASGVNGDLNIVKFLVKSRADVNAKDGMGQTALMHASGVTGNLDIVRFLVESKADVDVKDEVGWTALMLASGVLDNPDLDIVKFLVKSKADVNAKDGMEQTALMHASGVTGNLDIVRFLVENKADVNTKDRIGETALMKANEKGNQDIVEYLKNAQNEYADSQPYKFQDIETEESIDDFSDYNAFHPSGLYSDQKRMILKYLQDIYSFEDYYNMLQKHGEDALIQYAVNEFGREKLIKSARLHAEKKEKENKKSTIKWFLGIAAMIHGVYIIFHLDQSSLELYHYIIGIFTIPFGAFSLVWLFTAMDDIKWEGKVVKTILSFIVAGFTIYCWLKLGGIIAWMMDPNRLY